MLVKIKFISIAITIWLSLMPFMVIAEDMSPHEIIEKSSHDVLTALKNDEIEIKSNPNKINELVDEIILPICDLERMGKYILAKHWKTATDDQRLTFVNEFKKMLIRNYGKHIAEHSNAKVTVIPVKQIEGKLYQTVSTKLNTQIGSKPFHVDYVFRVTDSSSKVVDVRIEGMSILKTFRTAFSQEIAETSLEELLERISLVNEPSLAFNTSY